MTTVNKYTGCLMGLAIGDAFGAPYEGGYAERLLWKLIGKTKSGKYRYTDDTQMSIDVAHSFIENHEIDPDHLASTFARSYRWSRGYGPGAATLLKKIKKGQNWREANRARFKDGSYGNGAAMRAPVVTMCFPYSEDVLKNNVYKSSVITHAHPLAIEGAQLVAFLTYAALHDWENETIIRHLPTKCNEKIYKEKMAICLELVQSEEYPKSKTLKQRLGNGIGASESCVTAIYFALKYRKDTLNNLLSQIRHLGGDTDTIGAIAGAIWGAFNGIEAIDQSYIQKIENSLYTIGLAEHIYAISSDQQVNIDTSNSRVPINRIK
jgi:poly(ADP-ribose) glycohydrolase ARH3